MSLPQSHRWSPRRMCPVWKYVLAVVQWVESGILRQVPEGSAGPWQQWWNGQRSDIDILINQCVSLRVCRVGARGSLITWVKSGGGRRERPLYIITASQKNVHLIRRETPHEEIKLMIDRKLIVMFLVIKKARGWWRRRTRDEDELIETVPPLHLFKFTYTLKWPSWRRRFVWTVWLSLASKEKNCKSRIMNRYVEFIWILLFPHCFPLQFFDNFCTK